MRPADRSSPVLPLDDETITGLRAAFPGWNIWRSDEGRWWASRRAALPPSRRPEDYALTLTADNPRLLASHITGQPSHNLPA